MTGVVVTSAPRWNRVAPLLDTALEREPEARARYLEEACAGDPALRAEIDALLAGGEASSFLDVGALVFAAPLLEAAAENDDLNAGSGLPPPYRLERKLGRGGMAAVYVARDTKHDRRVAVKVLHSHLTARVEAERFVQEIRLTARLQHPHVLALLDSGVFPPEAGALAGRPSTPTA